MRTVDLDLSTMAFDEALQRSISVIDMQIEASMRAAINDWAPKYRGNPAGFVDRVEEWREQLSQWREQHVRECVEMLREMYGHQLH
jgi:hypothetical protein